MRLRILLVCCAALALTVGVVASAGVAVAANPPSLNGEELFSVTATNDYGSCVLAPGQMVPFGVASGVASAAPYPGTFTASGSETLDPSTDDVTALNGTFAIHDATDGVEISGTLSLNGSTGSHAACDASSAHVNYTATITTATMTCTDTGTAILDTNDASVFDLYSFASASLTCGASAQSLLGQSKDQLLLLLQQQAIKAAAKAKMQKASDILAQVQASPAWITGSWLDPQTGSTVFDGIQKAIADASSARNLAPKADEAPLTAVMQTMKDATVSISDTALQQALVLATVLPALAAQVQQEIKLAQKFEEKALAADVIRGNVVDQIQQLQNSWKWSDEALKVFGWQIH